ncbi:hypothetical protein TNCV_206481 [Trichonephila clavipes]|nr:hypothetical protein TNCV_206481 [Trichonephila clavipes]
MRTRDYCAHPSIRGRWAMRCLSRCPDKVFSMKRDPQCLSPQAILALICQSTAEDFGKQNMPGKRARRHFSQLCECERGLIIGMKTAGWSPRRVDGQVDRSSVPLEIVGSCGHEKVPTR